VKRSLATLLLLASTMPGRAAGDGELGGTNWRLVQIQSMDDAQGTTRVGDPSLYTVSFGTDGRATLRLNCNRATGPWQAKAAADGQSGSLGFGMLAENGAFFSFSSAYDAVPGPDLRVIARYGAKDILMSGWLEGDQAIAGRAAVVEARAGLGRAVLIGFRAQHRAQTVRTFKLLFNALYRVAPQPPID